VCSRRLNKIIDITVTLSPESFTFSEENGLCLIQDSKQDTKYGIRIFFFVERKKIVSCQAIPEKSNKGGTTL
jgi:imidazoleglycerol phosphate synthase glutamine amidotransferase subunit HisH